MWHNKNANAWETAALNTTLNTTFYNSITDKTNIIQNPIWNIGMSNDGTTITTPTNYQGTTAIPKPVGLLNIDEYTKTGGASAWLLENGSMWTITNAKGNSVYSIEATGTTSTSRSNTSKIVKPVIYINKDIYLTGNGTLSDPFVII